MPPPQTVKVALKELDAHIANLRKLRADYLDSLKTARDMSLSRRDFGDCDNIDDTLRDWNDACDTRQKEVSDVLDFTRFVLNRLVSVRELYDETDKETAKKYPNIPR